MRALRVRRFALFVLAALISAAHPGRAQPAPPASQESRMPSDIDPQSGFRLPLPRREDLDEAGFSPRIREIAILTTAREMDSQFEWVAHEPEALKEGVPQAVIDVIKFRRGTEGLDETDATVIALGRQLWHDHKVTPATFAKAKALFGPNKLIDLVLLMGNYAGTAALLTAVDMQLHKGKQPLLPIP